MSKPSIPKGTRDFGPLVMARRNWMIDIMRRSFERFGFQPIETPAMENLQTLTGKYGEEGDQLIFKILNNGDYLQKADQAAITDGNSGALTPSISKKALRYDLTVPFARFVVMSRNDLAFPFRRYQIQTVWRGDRPGKGRYQEFTQCDADIIGSDGLMCELDLMVLFHEILTELGVPGFEIAVNDRRLLNGLARSWNMDSHFQDFTVALDKWDKIGAEGVEKELVDRGMDPRNVQQLIAFFDKSGAMDSSDRLKIIQAQLQDDDEKAHQALTELTQLFDLSKSMGVSNESLVFDPTLARGLNYYTGAIFEVRVPEAPIGSICGGGRYADLTGIFGWEGMSGVGISFGADRIYDVLEHCNKFPTALASQSRLLIVQMDVEGEAYGLELLRFLRKEGYRVFMYPEVTKLKKQLKYADDAGISHVLIAGEDERNSGVWTVRNMVNGEQMQLSPTAISEHLMSNLA
ncbi:MAG: histidine--tRNA ligase [Bacteroidetes bacterium]|nr:histidine--tRNA ligase [Bacteroidota bacterium]MDA1336743.1 histidine--tRNA ligase [Bacteroidota bacterium]